MSLIAIKPDVSSLAYIFHSCVLFPCAHTIVFSSPLPVELLSEIQRAGLRNPMPCIEQSRPLEPDASSPLPVKLLWFFPIPNLYAHRDRESRPPEPDALHRAEEAFETRCLASRHLLRCARVCGQSGFCGTPSGTALYSRSATSWRW